MVTTMIYGKAERLRSYELLAREWGLSALHFHDKAHPGGGPRIPA